jgi:hypothetical protein
VSTVPKDYYHKGGVRMHAQVSENHLLQHLLAWFILGLQIASRQGAVAFPYINTGQVYEPAEKIEQYSSI